MSSTGTIALRSALAHSCVDELDLATRAGNEPADLLERALLPRGRRAGTELDESFEALERQRKMGAAFLPASACTVESRSIPGVSRACDVSSRRSSGCDQMSGGVRAVRAAPPQACPRCAPTDGLEPSPEGLRRFRSMS